MSMKEALERIAAGDYEDYAGNPSLWASTIAMKALGWTWKEGVAYPPIVTTTTKSTANYSGYAE